MRTLIAALCVALTFVAHARAQSTAFTYQGQLKDAGLPAEGQHDFRFRLFDAATGGTQVGATQCVDNLQVQDGAFAATVDFGAAFTTPATRFIEVEVRRDTGLNCSNTTGFVVLTPRQLIAAAPIATHAKSAFALDAADGSVANVVFVDNAGKVGIGTTTPANRLSINGNADITGYIGIGTPTPAFPLHVASPFAVLGLQDLNADAAQAGYVSYRNHTGTETAWVGFGSAGDPDFSIINARAGGDIVLNPFSGNVGIGTSAPNAKLDVRGDIRLGTTGQFRAVSGENSLRVANGSCDASGHITAGSGTFTINHTATGSYTVTLTTPMFGQMSVVATPHGTDRILNITVFGGSSFIVQATTTSNASADIGFEFVAVGIR